MRVSLGRTSIVALALGLMGGVGTACADSEEQGYTPPPVDNGDATLPPTPETDAAPPEAAVDAGPKACSDHGFCPTNVPGDQTIEGLWGDGSGIVWAVTTQGSVLRWEGNAWTVHASKLGPLHTIWGSGPTDLWIGGDKGVQHGTGATSASLTFAPSTLPGDGTPITSLWGRSANDVWAISFAYDPNTGESIGNVLHFGGASGAGDEWELDPVSSNGVAYSRVWGAESGVWIAGTRPQVDEPWYSELVVLRKVGAADFVEVGLPADPTASGSSARPGSLASAVAVSNDAVWITGRTAGYSPMVWRGVSADNGATFTFSVGPDSQPGAPPINSMFGIAANDVWAAGEFGRLRHWNGTAWSTASVTTTKFPINKTFFSVWAHGTSDVWVGGEGVALRFDPTQEKNGGVD